MSDSKINMSLDDIIKNQRKSFKRGGQASRGGRNSRVFRGNRKFSNGSNTLPLNKNTNKDFNSFRGNRGRNTNDNNIRGRGGIRSRSTFEKRGRLNNQRNLNTPQNKRVNKISKRKNHIKSAEKSNL